MWRWMAVLIFCASSAGAEQWADEPPEQPPPAEVRPPLVGLIAGGELVASGVINDGPGLGLRLGVRVALAQHVSLGLLLDWESVSLVPDGPGPNELHHLASALFLFELFTHSSFERLLVPELGVGVLAGSGVGLSPSGTYPGGELGLHFGLTRLRPSGWWFPFFANVLYAFDGQGGTVRLVVGVGL